VKLAIKIKVINATKIDIDSKSFFLFAIIYKCIHITIKRDINNVNHTIHCSNNICINQFSGKNLCVCDIVLTAICQFHADSIEFHIWLAGQAIHKP